MNEPRFNHRLNRETPIHPAIQDSLGRMIKVSPNSASLSASSSLRSLHHVGRQRQHERHEMYIHSEYRFAEEEEREMRSRRRGNSRCSDSRGNGDFKATSSSCLVIVLAVVAVVDREDREGVCATSMIRFNGSPRGRREVGRARKELGKNCHQHRGFLAAFESPGRG